MNRKNRRANKSKNRKEHKEEIVVWYRSEAGNQWEEIGDGNSRKMALVAFGQMKKQKDPRIGGQFAILPRGTMPTDADAFRITE